VLLGKSSISSSNLSLGCLGSGSNGGFVVSFVSSISLNLESISLGLE
jgi:hypothetical protein